MTPEEAEELKQLRYGLEDTKKQIKRILEFQRNSGQIASVEGKNALSQCIAALARFNDEDAIRKALVMSLAFLKREREREELLFGSEDKNAANG